MRQTVASLHYLVLFWHAFSCALNLAVSYLHHWVRPIQRHSSIETDRFWVLRLYNLHSHVLTSHSAKFEAICQSSFERHGSSAWHQSTRGTDEKPRTRTGKISKRANPRGDESRRSSSHMGLKTSPGQSKNSRTILTDLVGKHERARNLHAQRIHEDAEDVLTGEELKVSRQNRWKDIGLVVFGFVLHEAQIETIWTLFYEQKDLILIAKAGFGKSRVFQLHPFMTDSIGARLTATPLKLLQTEQSDTINRRIPVERQSLFSFQDLDDFSPLSLESSSVSQFSLVMRISER